MSRVIFDADRSGPRHCGDCQLCCRLVPVRGLDKPAGKRCKFQKFHKGCTVYHQPEKGFPAECQFWSCRWLNGEPGTEKLSRPDRAHYVLDPMPDFITVVNKATQEETKIEVIQIWCDPAFPDAHRDPALRAFIVAQGSVAGLVRYSASRALYLMPPHMMETRQWTEWSGDRATMERQHSAAEIAKAVGVKSRVILAP
jgi:hypothetical protein